MCPHISPVLTLLGLSSVLPHAKSLPRISHPFTRPASFTKSHQEAPRACRAPSLPPGRVGSAAGESTPLRLLGRPFPSLRQCFSDPSSDPTAEPPGHNVANVPPGSLLSVFLQLPPRSGVLRSFPEVFLRSSRLRELFE